jgi:thymidylate synthase
MEQINARIKQEICYDTLHELSDEKLLCDYKNCHSVQNEIKKLADILEKYTDEETKQKIIDEYIPQLIPAGTKGVIRGNKFNKIVKEHIIMLNLDKDRFEICFEKKCPIHNTTEIPDWYILDKRNNLVIIGMNQLDLWSGGHQTNRGSKYIDNNENNTNNSKLLCVVCYDIQFKSDKNKAYKLFVKGFENNTLCYLNNISNIINIYFSV